MAKVVSLHINPHSPSYNSPQRYSSPSYRTNRILSSSKGQASHRRPVTAHPSTTQFTTGLAPVTQTQIHQLFPYRIVYQNEPTLNSRCQVYKEDPCLLPNRVSPLSNSFSKQLEETPIIAPSPSPTPPAVGSSKEFEINEQKRSTPTKHAQSRRDDKIFYYHYVPYNKMTTAEKKLLFQMKDLRTDDQLKDFFYKRRQVHPQWPHSIPVKLAYHTAEMSQHYRSTPDKQWNLNDICHQVNSLHKDTKSSKSFQNMTNRISSSFTSQINATSINTFPYEDEDVDYDLQDPTLIKLLESTSNEVLRVTSIDDGANLHKGKRSVPGESALNDEEFYPENDTSLGFHEEESTSSSRSEHNKHMFTKDNSRSSSTVSPHHFMKPTSQSTKLSSAEVSKNNFLKRNAILKEQMEIFVDWVNVERLKKLENRRCHTGKPSYRTFSAMLHKKHHEESGFFVTSPKVRANSTEPVSTDPQQEDHFNASQQASTSPNELLNIWETLRIH